MIIVEDSKSQLAPQDHALPTQLSGNANLGPVSPQSPSGSAPSYTPSYHANTPLLPPSPPPSYPKYPNDHHRPAPPPAPAVHYRQSPLKRFWKAFAVALLIYLAFVSLTHTALRMAHHSINWEDGSVGTPRGDDGRILESIGPLNWSSYQPRPRWAPNFSQSAETSFTLSIASEQLYLISRGAYQNGKVQVKQSTERGEDVRVDVRVAYHDERALARATVCRLQKSGNRNGVGIYTPTPAWADPHDRLHFDVVFTFPAATSESSPLRIKDFTTQTSNFAHEIGDLWQSMLFENMALETANAPIQANSITLTRGSLISSNGPITGHFNTSDSLILRTSNGRIQVTASLFNAGASATKLDMRTDNSPITSSVSLITSSGSGGNYLVKARSSNGAIKLQYDDAPLRARLVSDARTSNGSASVVLHPAYEGTFEVSTSNSHPVVRDTRAVDPSGAGRRRVVHQTTLRGTIKGTASWGEGGRGEGVCTVHTSNGRVSLDL